MNKIVWVNSTTSGLCDRLIDLSLMSTLASILGSDLYLQWKEHPPLNEFQRRVWPIERMEDYKIENFKKFFSIPENVKIVNNLNTIDNSYRTHYFSDYLGGVYNSKTFHSRYASTICDFSRFQEEYDKTLHNFKFLGNRSNEIEQFAPNRIDIGVHLRRTDKITDSPDPFQITTDQLTDLETKTNNFLVSFLESKKGQVNLFLCSDSEQALSNFKEKYKSYPDLKIFSSLNHVNGIEKTYFDIYFLSRSETILMSQKHSNFSIFSSLIGNKSLVYLYENNLIQNGYFPEFKFYKDVTK